MREKEAAMGLNSIALNLDRFWTLFFSQRISYITSESRWLYVTSIYFNYT